MEWIYRYLSHFAGFKGIAAASVSLMGQARHRTWKREPRALVMSSLVECPPAGMAFGIKPTTRIGANGLGIAESMTGNLACESHCKTTPVLRHANA